MKSLRLKKLKLPLSTLWAMSDESRSALLPLGLFLNEANWLRKLLVKPVRALPAELVRRPLTPEEEANHALTTLLMTTLVGKIWEGWNLISRGDKLRPTLEGLSLPSEVKSLEAQLKQELSKDLFVRIRNNVSFHYSEKLIDISRLKNALTEGDAARLRNRSRTYRRHPLLSFYPREHRAGLASKPEFRSWDSLTRSDT